MSQPFDHDFDIGAPPTREATRTMTVMTGVGYMVDPFLSSNPYVQSAIQILDQLSDLGKTLPFIAPAFILLKIIIDIEKKARDADTKCNDLLERINFMLSNLPELKRLEVKPATRQVIDRINNALKDAAALISAYRNQGRIARRLTFTNRDKFVACVDALNACSSDLMVTLQIQQAGALEILTRAVPVDPGDKAAEEFVSRHGSLDEVRKDRRLVTEFAEQQHLSMDDTVMEQLSADFSDVMHQNLIQLEGLLKQNVGAAVIDGLKGLAAEINAAEAEQRFTCVQCDKEFRNSTNGSKSCSFHSAEYDSWNKSYPCCGMAHPCKFTSHRAHHHCDYPYGPFFQRARNITGYIDTVEQWASLEDVNLETSKIPKCSLGRLLRWVSRGARIEEEIIILSIGTVWHNSPYFFDTFSPKQLVAISQGTELTRDTMIFRTSSNDSEFAMGEWVLSSTGSISGIRLSVKAATSECPYVTICPLDIATCSKSGEIIPISEGGLHAFKSAGSYVLPRYIRVGPKLKDEKVRAVRTNFKTKTSSADFRVVLKCTSDPPLIANPELASTEVDYFRGSVAVFNNFPAGSQTPVTVGSVSAFYRLVGDDAYLPAQSCKVQDGPHLPSTIDPRQSLPINFEIAVPRSPEDVKRNIRWWNRAFVARMRPIRIKLVLEDMDENQCSLVFEYIYQPYPYAKKNADDIDFFYFDHPEDFHRNANIHVKKADGNGNVIQISHSTISKKQLEQMVYKALKTGETEIDLEIGQDQDSWEWRAWALIDISCQKVYAFKILLTEGRHISPKRLGCLGYVACPEYGKVLDEIRAIRYAEEKIGLPDLEPYRVHEYPNDDIVDDYVPEPSTTSSINVTSGSPSQLTIPEELSHRLVSIDSSLSRIASALEKLVDVLERK